MHTYIHACMHACMHASVHAYMAANYHTLTYCNDDDGDHDDDDEDNNDDHDDDPEGGGIVAIKMHKLHQDIANVSVIIAVRHLHMFIQIIVHFQRHFLAKQKHIQGERTTTICSPD